jgi:hypothetical protein
MKVYSSQEQQIIQQIYDKGWMSVMMMEIWDQMKINPELLNDRDKNNFHNHIKAIIKKKSLYL